MDLIQLNLHNKSARLQNLQQLSVTKLKSPLQLQMHKSQKFFTQPSFPSSES